MVEFVLDLYPWNVVVVNCWLKAGDPLLLFKFPEMLSALLLIVFAFSVSIFSTFSPALVLPFEFITFYSLL